MNANTNVIWINRDLNKEENIKYIDELNTLISLNISTFENLDMAIEYMKSIKFQETKIIINDELYSEFVKKFKENIIDICIAPKIIIFAKNKKRFIDNNKDYQKELFYNFGGAVDTFQEVVKFIKNENVLIKTDDAQLTFEYIDKKEKLLLPLFFKTLIDKISNENINSYTSNLYDDYSEKNEDVKNLLGPIKDIKNIPIEILSKYYARLYTAESDFYKKMNKDLGSKELNNVEKYLPYIKALYEGVKLKSLPLANNNILYRGSKISNDEIEKIKNYIKDKKEGLPSSIVFCKSFLSFSKNKHRAYKFLNIGNNKDNNKYNEQSNENIKLSKVLFILEKDDKIEYNLSTHGDIENISFYPIEEEVLFFPFSPFEIKDIKLKNIDDENIYEIKLKYLDEYLKDIENDKNLIISEDQIPDSDFKKQLSELGLIKKEKIEKISPKILYNNFKQYEYEINNSDKNIILGEIYIKEKDVNKDIRIINSYENCIKEEPIRKEEDESRYKNEKEIKRNIEIKINENIIPFSYYHKFEEEGKYIIQYTFKNPLTKTNHMFYKCNSLINLDFTYFNSYNITNMSEMFNGCASLKDINLTNFNTQYVTDMSYMFCCCHSLINLNLSYFNTQNVINMCGMFNYCNSLMDLNISNFNTQNVTDMREMFSFCYSLTNINLSNFNTQNVIDMSKMFYNCNSLTKINLSSFNTKKIIYMREMFKNCSSLKHLNLSNSKIKKPRLMCDMFEQCNSLIRKNIITKDKKILEEFFNYEIKKI